MGASSHGENRPHWNSFPSPFPRPSLPLKFLFFNFFLWNSASIGWGRGRTWVHYYAKCHRPPGEIHPLPNNHGEFSLQGKYRKFSWGEALNCQLACPWNRTNGRNGSKNCVWGHPKESRTLSEAEAFLNSAIWDCNCRRLNLEPSSACQQCILLVSKSPRSLICPCIVPIHIKGDLWCLFFHIYLHRMNDCPSPPTQGWAINLDFQKLD